MEILLDLFKSSNPLIGLLVLAIAIVVAFIVHFLLFKIIKVFLKYKFTSEYKYIFKMLRKPSMLLFLTISLKVALPIIKLNDSLFYIIQHILSILVIATIAWLLIQGTAITRIAILKQYNLKNEDNLNARKAYTQFRILERIIITLIITIAIAAALMTFDKIKQIGASLLASAGIAGIILGFAAQRAIATILAGFQIAITQPIRIDDVVIVEGEWGRIEEITLTYVVVHIWDKRRLIVPTTYFIEKPFQNWTRTTSAILGTVYIYLDYKVPVDEIRKKLSRILEGNENWDKEVNVVQVTNATDKTMEVRALIGAPDSGAAWNLRVHVREQLIKFLNENYPESLPRIRVEMNKLSED